MKNRPGLLFGALLFFGLIAFAARPAAAQTGGLNGVWCGYYGYDDKRPNVKFQVKLASDGASLSGSTVEPNTFGDPAVYFLTAGLNGVIGSNGSVHFIKTYDGTGGQSHSVDYAGALDATHRCITGRWTLQGASGPFKVCSDARLLS